jgi:hypothetical protein
MSHPNGTNGYGNGFAISSPSPTASTFNREQVPHAGDASFGEDDEVSVGSELRLGACAGCRCLRMKRLKHVLRNKGGKEGVDGRMKRESKANGNPIVLLRSTVFTTITTNPLCLLR